MRYQQKLKRILLQKNPLEAEVAHDLAQIKIDLEIVPETAPSLKVGQEVALSLKVGQEVDQDQKVVQGVVPGAQIDIKIMVE